MKLIKKNKRSKDCVIVAAYNAAIWRNMPYTYEKVEEIARGCGYNPKKGMYRFQFIRLVKKLNIPTRKIEPKSVEELTSKLNIGKFLVLLYTPTGEGRGHAATAFMDHQGHIRVINPENQRPTWSELIADIKENGMKEFHVYELPRRQLA